MTAFFNRHESDPIDKLREAVEAMERCDRIHVSEKPCCIDVGKAGGDADDAAYLSEQLKLHGCKSFARDATVYAFGEAYEKAMEREALKPIPIAPLPRDPEVEKAIWTWHVSFLP